MKKLKIPYPIIVEGKYDRLRLLCVCDAHIITTDGFGIFKKKEKLALFRALAEKTKIIVLSDSDGAGKLIRSHIGSAVPKDRLIQLYIPQIQGCEARKSAPSAEGTLGVEGMETEFLYKLLLPYCDEKRVELAEKNPLSKADFFEDGLSGRADSAARRDEFAKNAGLPSGMTANALLEAVKLIMTYGEYLAAVGRTENEKK